MPVCCLLESGTKCQQPSLSASPTNELYSDWHSESVESRREGERATTDMVDPTRELPQRRSAFVDGVESRCAAMHCGKQQDLTGL